MKKLIIGVTSALVGLALFAGPAFATKTQGDPNGPTSSGSDIFQNSNNWKILDRVTLPNGNVNFMTRHPDALTGGGTTFPFLEESQGYTSYQLLNYHQDLTGKTISADVHVNTTGATFVAKDDCVANVGLEFQDTAAGTYNSNDYWWSTDRPTLASLTSSTHLSSLLTEAGRANWINQSGKPATDPETNWVEWQGDTVAMSPYDGFTQAMKNVKEVSFSFGGCGYARGVAVSAGSASFEVTNFSVTP